MEVFEAKQDPKRLHIVWCETFCGNIVVLFVQLYLFSKSIKF